MKHKLNILMFTPTIDVNEDIHGFIHEWVKKMSNSASTLHVVALSVGQHNLPNNVKVYSLGKEKTGWRFIYILNFYKHLIKILFTNKIDIVFCHMTHQYVIMMAMFTKIFRIPIILWKTHGGITLSLKMATKLTTKIITASEESFNIKTNKKIVVGHGIDTDLFNSKSQNNNKNIKIISIGRISRSKNYKNMIEAADILVKQNKLENVKFEIIGKPFTADEEKYLKELKQEIEQKKLENNFVFLGNYSFKKIIPFYQNCDIFINLSDTESLDKAVLEAMACEKIVITSNYAFKPILEKHQNYLITEKNNPEMLGEKIIDIINLDKEKKNLIEKDLRKIVVTSHNLDNLINKIINIFKQYA